MGRSRQEDRLEVIIEELTNTNDRMREKLGSKEAAAGWAAGQAMIHYPNAMYTPDQYYKAFLEAE